MSNSSTPLFSFTTDLEGEYQLCFENERMENSPFKFKYLSGAEALDYTLIAKRKDANEIESELMKI